MSQFGHGPSRQTSREAGPPVNIYTALLGIALVALLAAIIFIWMRSANLFGTTTPFEVVLDTGIHSISDFFNRPDVT